MRPVQVRIDTEHLSEDLLADLDKVGREAGALASPVVPVGGRITRGSKWRIRKGDAGGIGGKDLGVVDLGTDVTLNEGEILVRRYLNGL